MKSRRLIAAALLPATLCMVMGCYSTRRVQPHDLTPAKGNREAEAVRGVLTLSGEEVQFDNPVLPVADTLHASVNGDPYEIALDQVDRVVVKRKDRVGSLLLVGTLFFVAVLAVIVVINDEPEDEPLNLSDIGG